MDAKFKISEVLALNGATSIGEPKPIKRGPINFPPPKTGHIIFMNMKLHRLTLQF